MDKGKLWGGGGERITCNGSKGVGGEKDNPTRINGDKDG
jgi:hypothetical protein